jgi:hypothetical protein
MSRLQVTINIDSFGVAMGSMMAPNFRSTVFFILFHHVSSRGLSDFTLKRRLSSIWPFLQSMPAGGLSAVSTFSFIATPVRATPRSGSRYPSREMPAAHAAWNELPLLQKLASRCIRADLRKIGVLPGVSDAGWYYLTRDPGRRALDHLYVCVKTSLNRPE